MAATPWTRRELIDEALDNLGVLVQGQAPSDEMVDKVDKVLDPCIESLRARAIIYVADTGTADPPSGGEFPVEICLPLSHCLAYAAAPKFSLAGDPAIKVQCDLAENELRVISRPPSSRRMLRVDRALRGDRRYGLGNFTRGT